MEAAPHGVFKCKGDDRWCTIGIFDDQGWRSFCNAIGKPEWIAKPEFSTLTARKTHETKLNHLIEQWTENHEAEEVMKILQQAGIAAGVVQNAKDLYQDIQLKERECFWSAHHKEMGEITYLGQPSRLSRTKAEIYRGAPCLGEHTEHICREYLGMSQEEFDKYLVQGVFE